MYLKLHIQFQKTLSNFISIPEAIQARSQKILLLPRKKLIRTCNNNQLQQYYLWQQYQKYYKTPYSIHCHTRPSISNRGHPQSSLLQILCQMLSSNQKAKMIIKQWLISLGNFRLISSLQKLIDATGIQNIFLQSCAKHV